MKKKRGKTQIITQILETCTNSTSISNITNEANMNLYSIKPYLATLAKNGLIEPVDGTLL